MIISDVEVQGFGVWSGLKLPGLSDQLNVIYGPNEAGKSTLLQFLRAMLYGFTPERRARFLPPFRGGRGGGRLQIRTVAGVLTVSRFDAPGDSDAVVSARPGGPPTSRSLAELLGGVDESTFNHVFAFGLREIQQLGTLTDTQAAHWLYDLTLGVDHVSLADVMERLEAWRNKLLAPADVARADEAAEQTAQVTQLLARREQLHIEIDELRELTGRYFEAVQNQRHLAASIEQLQKADADIEHRLWVAGMARTLADKWHARASLEQQLRGLGNVEPLPEGAVEQFNELRERESQFTARVARLRQRRTQLRREAEAIDANVPLCKQGPRLEALSEQQQWLTFLAEQVRSLEEQTAEHERQQDAEDKRWTAVVGKRGDGKLPATTERQFENVRSAARHLRTHRQGLREAKQAAATHKRSLAELKNNLTSALGGRAEQGLTTHLAQAGELVSQLRRRVQIDERLDQISRKLKDLDASTQEWSEKQMLSGQALVGWGALIVAGIFGVLSGLFLPAALTHGLGWFFALLGAGAAAVGIAAIYHLKNFATEQLMTCHKQVRSLQHERREISDERDALDAKLPRGGGPLVSRLQTAEKELAELEKLVPLQGHSETAKRDAQHVRKRHREARASHRDARGRWRKALKEAGLPENLVPKQIRDFQQHTVKSQARAKRLAELREQAAQRRREYDALCSRIGQVAAEVGHKPNQADPVGQLRELLAELRGQQGKMERRETLLDEARQAHRRMARCVRRLAALRQRRERLLADLHLADAAELDWRVEQLQETQRLQRDLATLSAEITATLGQRATEAELAEILLGELTPAALDARLQQQRSVGRNHLEQLFEQRGQLREQLKSLASDTRLTEKQIELAALETRLEKALERWRVLAVSLQVLESVREIYERERQPAALREASVYLRLLTGGRYTRVWTPLGHRVLRVDDARGNALPVEVLSRGTREQLFLSLRLAIIRAYSDQGIRLPLVLDDVLVNFDQDRARAAAAVLRDFTRQGHQVLVFTCHQHIAELFKGVHAHVRQLPNNMQVTPSFAAVAEEPEPVEEVPAAVLPEPVSVQPPRATPLPVEPLPPRALPLEPAPVLQAVPLPPDEPPPAAVLLEPPPTAVLLEPPPVAEALPPEPEPPPRPRPKPRPAKPPAPKRRRISQVQTVRWSAEEFEGELADRVARGVNWVEIPGPETIVEEVETVRDEGAGEAAAVESGRGGENNS